ncbi:efflux RND transporter periplasmic adaptor subunit [Xanthocytophaga agilis]|uniref:Efflux RND transporter periplasmic adaptor subunit n=1 Tax=Xanthocytophaga agilis TaxID=3048010 RepID=A0AAE3QYN5_9BACT|nr:efflux RND transporter periplasmic adaptor subunit [Xanthocytophaga agilis]MDJ1499895.1 efflux RND transporter periplasmic adaptor subunit [Xanthocytophaga agilis]
MNLRIYFVLVSCFTGLIGCKQSPPEHKEEKSTFVLSDTMLSRVKITVAKTEPVKAELKLIGKITPDDNKLVEVFPLVGGNVMDVNAELGDYVEKGQILAVIRSGEVADYERQMIDAQSDLLMDQKNLRVAEDLFESKLNSERDVTAARKEVEKSQAELNRIQEIFRIYGLGKQSEYQVKAPISGFVIEKHINRDMQLRSDNAENIFTIAQINDVWVSANVYETDIARIKVGMEADVQTISYGDKIFHGKVDRIFNILDPETKTMKVRVKLQNPDYALKPEMNATVTLHFNEDKQMLSVPSSAVIFDKSKHFVMVFKDRYNIETREVELYKQANSMAYIQSGLQEAEKVVSQNQLFIYDALND